MRWMAVIVVAALGMLGGCVNANSLALKVGKPPDGAVKLRNMQTRRFDAADDKVILAASVQTLQDLGFTITEAAPGAGVVAGSKQRDAEEAGQVAGQVALAMLAALGGNSYTPVWDKEQTIQVTLVATPITNAAKVDVRVSFDRVLTNNQGQIWRAELLNDPKLYQQFFQGLSKSAFLEAHEL